MTNEYAEMEKQDMEFEASGLSVVFNFLNSSFYGNHIRDAVLAINRQHRTLQDYFGRLCIAYLHLMSKKKSGEYDGRNEYIVKVARQMKPILDEYDSIM